MTDACIQMSALLLKTCSSKIDNMHVLELLYAGFTFWSLLLRMISPPCMQVTNEMGYGYAAPVEATKDNKMMGLRGWIASCMTHIDTLLSICSICLLSLFVQKRYSA